MTQLSGFALNTEPSFEGLPATLDGSMLFCALLTHSARVSKGVCDQNSKSPRAASSLLPLTWFCLALCGSGCRRSGSYRRTATGWRHPGPSAEPSPRGWAQRRLWQCACRIMRENSVRQRHWDIFKGFCDTGEDQRKYRRERESMKDCSFKVAKNQTRLKLNSTELFWKNNGLLSSTPWRWTETSFKNPHPGSLNDLNGN